MVPTSELEVLARQFCACFAAGSTSAAASNVLQELFPAARAGWLLVEATSALWISLSGFLVQRHSTISFLPLSNSLQTILTSNAVLVELPNRAQDERVCGEARCYGCNLVYAAAGASAHEGQRAMVVLATAATLDARQEAMLSTLAQMSAEVLSTSNKHIARDLSDVFLRGILPDSLQTAAKLDKSMRSFEPGTTPPPPPPAQALTASQVDATPMSSNSIKGSHERDTSWQSTASASGSKLADSRKRSSQLPTQGPLLTFQDPTLEAQYYTWCSRHYHQADMLWACLTAAIFMMLWTPNIDTLAHLTPLQKFVGSIPTILLLVAKFIAPSAWYYRFREHIAMIAFLHICVWSFYVMFGERALKADASLLGSLSGQALASGAVTVLTSSVGIMPRFSKLAWVLPVAMAILFPRLPMLCTLCCSEAMLVCYLKLAAMLIASAAGAATICYSLDRKTRRLFCDTASSLRVSQVEGACALNVD